MPTARQVADYFLVTQDDESGEGITNLKLQKLVYYAQGFHLALHREPLFKEPVKAWTHGPVVPSLWADFRDYEAQPLPKPERPAKWNLTDDQRNLLDEVNEVYGQFSAWKLRDMTHGESPWQEAFDRADKTISPEAMRDFFRSRLV